MTLSEKTNILSMNKQGKIAYKQERVVVMDQETLRKVQLAQLEIGKEIRRVCVENDVKYFGGSGRIYLPSSGHQCFRRDRP